MGWIYFCLRKLLAVWKPGKHPMCQVLFVQLYSLKLMMKVCFDLLIRGEWIFNCGMKNGAFAFSLIFY